MLKALMITPILPYTDTRAVWQQLLNDYPHPSLHATREVWQQCLNDYPILPCTATRAVWQQCLDDYTHPSFHRY